MSSVFLLQDCRALLEEITAACSLVAHQGTTLWSLTPPQKLLSFSTSFQPLSLSASPPASLHYIHFFSESLKNKYCLQAYLNLHSSIISLHPDLEEKDSSLLPKLSDPTCTLILFFSYCEHHVSSFIFSLLASTHQHLGMFKYLLSSLNWNIIDIPHINFRCTT